MISPIALFHQISSGSLNRFRSGFLEPWCYLANQPAFPPVLSGTIVMKDASSTEGVAQCTPEVNSSTNLCCKMANEPWTLNLENDTPTDVITVRKENLLFFGSSWEPTFRVPNQFIFGRNAPNGSKLGARTGTEPVPCWWKRATSVYKRTCEVQSLWVPRPVSSFVCLLFFSRRHVWSSHVHRVSSRLLSSFVGRRVPRSSCDGSCLV